MRPCGHLTAQASSLAALVLDATSSLTTPFNWLATALRLAVTTGLSATAGAPHGVTLATSASSATATVTRASGATLTTAQLMVLAAMVAQRKSLSADRAASGMTAPTRLAAAPSKRSPSFLNVERLPIEVKRMMFGHSHRSGLGRLVRT